jgi:type IV secretion system protein VirB4
VPAGLHFTIAADDDWLAFCPLQYLTIKGDRAWAMEWIDIMLALNGLDTQPQQRNEIGTAVLNMHASGAKTLGILADDSR